VVSSKLSFKFGFEGVSFEIFDTSSQDGMKDVIRSAEVARGRALRRRRRLLSVFPLLSLLELDDVGQSTGVGRVVAIM
jgi:hypothetical protein